MDLALESKKINPRMEKSYDNREFIHSKDGRVIRMLSEYLYPEQYFRKYGISNAIVFYGSARALSPEQFDKKLKELNDNLQMANENEKDNIQKEIDGFLKTKVITDCYQEAMNLAEMLGHWSLKLPKKDRFYIATGGGPGMMEAANRGATRAKCPSIGLNISLPFEQAPNSYITDDLNFEFHYFFMRKFWFVYLAKAFVALPGGLGTIDELSEILTLIQTTKINKKLPIVLFNDIFWKSLIDFEYLVETGMISRKDLDLFIYCNTAEEAFEYITKELTLIHKLKFKK